MTFVALASVASSIDGDDVHRSPQLRRISANQTQVDVKTNLNKTFIHHGSGGSNGSKTEQTNPSDPSDPWLKMGLDRRLFNKLYLVSAYGAASWESIYSPPYEPQHGPSK